MAETNPRTETTPPRRPARQRVTETARRARETVKARADSATRATTETVDANPLGVLAGAIAIGAVAAALLPATRQELKTLGPWAEKMREALEEAFEAAKEAGNHELTAAGLTLAAASDGAGGIVGKLVKAAAAASTAAATSVKDRRSGGTAQAEPQQAQAQAQPMQIETATLDV